MIIGMTLREVMDLAISSGFEVNQEKLPEGDIDAVFAWLHVRQVEDETAFQFEGGGNDED